MWVMAASVIAFAITLNQKVYFVVLAFSFLFHAICLAVINRRGKSRGAGAEENTAEDPAKHAGKGGLAAAPQNTRRGADEINP